MSKNTVEKKLFPVMFISEDSSYYFERMHHYEGFKCNDSEIQIHDTLGRGGFETIHLNYFEENFVLIKRVEFAEYQRYVNNGDTDLIDLYIANMKNKYSNSFRDTVTGKDDIPVNPRKYSVDPFKDKKLIAVDEDSLPF